MFGNHLNAVEKAKRKNNSAMLLKLADDSDMQVRLAAIDGLGMVGGQETTNFLITHLHDPKPEIRIAVAQSLGEIGDMHTKALVSQQLGNETDPKVCDALRAAMSHLKDY